MGALTAQTLRGSFRTMALDRESFMRALESRDARFDGVFFVGITSTGIYCRPICPARVTVAANRRFFASAAAAERRGFRPCLRCRPELAPGQARVDAVPRLAQVACDHILAGALNTRSVAALARSLGVSDRQLRRAFHEELGLSPLELAQTRRLHLAKQLLTETSLSMTQVAMASGFRSVRRFNAVFLEQYRLNPRAVRRTARSTAPSGSDVVRINLAFRPPLAWDALLDALRARATPGVERVDAASYSRVVVVDGHRGVMRVSYAGADGAEPRELARDDRARTAPSGAPPVKRRSASAAGTESALTLEVSAALLPVLPSILARTRHLFDLDADPSTIASHLARSALGSLTARERGVRVPGAFDGFEVAVRAAIEQRLATRQATFAMGALAVAFGKRAATGDAELTISEIAADKLSRADERAIVACGVAMPTARLLKSLATRVVRGELSLAPSINARALVEQLSALGLSARAAGYVAMRVAHWPDAFPDGDATLLRAAGHLTPAGLRRAAEAWRPWRAYAAMILWMREESARSATKVRARHVSPGVATG